MYPVQWVTAYHLDLLFSRGMIVHMQLILFMIILIPIASSMTVIYCVDICLQNLLSTQVFYFYICPIGFKLVEICEENRKMIQIGRIHSPVARQDSMIFRIQALTNHITVLYHTLSLLSIVLGTYLKRTASGCCDVLSTHSLCNLHQRETLLTVHFKHGLSGSYQKQQVITNLYKARNFPD